LQRKLKLRIVSSGTGVSPAGLLRDVDKKTAGGTPAPQTFRLARNPDCGLLFLNRET
jgi:hypothetical protein